MMAANKGDSMKITRTVCAVMLLVAAAGCAAPEPEEITPAETAEELAAQVRAADEAFNQSVQDGDMDAFAALVAEDAHFYGDQLLGGREQVVKAWSIFFDPEAGVSLNWAPSYAEASGDLGYTRGRYFMTAPGPDGTPTEMSGAYVSIWRRGGDGLWRAAVDIGTIPQPNEPSPESS
jgi:ketosteroid isomerase-like protein